MLKKTSRSPCVIPKSGPGPRFPDELSRCPHLGEGSERPDQVRVLSTLGGICLPAKGQSGSNQRKSIPGETSPEIAQRGEGSPRSSTSTCSRCIYCGPVPGGLSGRSDFPPRRIFPLSGYTREEFVYGKEEAPGAREARSPDQHYKWDKQERSRTLRPRPPLTQKEKVQRSHPAAPKPQNQVPVKKNTGLFGWFCLGVGSCGIVGSR